jgi:dTDP-4-amino-4,6-dideoxygalactose transaminase
MDMTADEVAHPDAAGKLHGRSRASAVKIPLLVPDLPAAEDLLPYLRRIDASRWYTNFGPLVRELEAGIAARACAVGRPAQHAVSVSNASLGLEVALLALGRRAAAYRCRPDVGHGDRRLRGSRRCSAT